MYDYIIIDTPPINLVSDALPVIKKSDGVILVVRQNLSTHPEVERALSALQFIDAKILGFIVNFSDPDAKSSRYGRKAYRYSYSDYGYGYGYGYSSKDKRR